MIKNDKIFELKIQEDDDVSGIDSISLVDEPAIEVNWVAFKKEIQEDFHIPDGEDETYLQKLLSKGQDEQELLDEGWEVVKVERVKDNFATTPNVDSSEDTSLYRVRYKYGLNQSISQNPIISTTRQFCRDLIMKNYVWRIEEIESELNSFGQSAQFWRGGYNCRHEWFKIFYQKTGDILNKSSINKNKVLGGGFPVELSPDWIQPNTITDKTMNNPSPSTVKNLGMSKEEFAGEKVSIDYDDTLSTDRGKELAKKLLSEGINLYIVTRRQETDLGPVLKVADELGISKDKVHATNGKLKWETIKRLGIMKHIDNNPDELKAIKENLPDVQTEKFGYDNVLPPYVDELPKKKKSYLDEFEYLSPKVDMSKQHFATDNEKHIVLGPAMIPDQKIFRKDNQGNPYYVFFSPETIKMIAEKYMKNKYIDNNDQMHDGKAVKDVYVIESWIKEDQNDKSNKYGFENLPVGTWFVSMKVNNPEIWSKVKDGQLNGFSVSGFFNEVAQFSKEEMFLYKVAEVLKRVNEK